MKARIEVFDGATAAAMGAFRELQPSVYIRDVYECPDQIPENVSHPEKSSLLVLEVKNDSKESSSVQPEVLKGKTDIPLQAVVDQDSLDDEMLADSVVDIVTSNDIESVTKFNSNPAGADDLLDLDQNDSISMLEEQEREAESALMQQLEDVVAPSKATSTTEELSKTFPKGTKPKDKLKAGVSQNATNKEKEPLIKEPTEMQRIDALMQKLQEQDVALTSKTTSAVEKLPKTFAEGIKPKSKLNAGYATNKQGKSLDNEPTEMQRIDRVLAQLDKLKEGHRNREGGAKRRTK